MKYQNFQVVESLGERNGYSFHRATVDDLKSNCLIKKPSTEAGAAGWDQLCHEYEICSGRDLQGVLRPVAQETDDMYQVILFEDPGGTTLEQLLKEKPLKLGLFFPVAIELVETIGRIHRREIIHKDIHPGNIIVCVNQEPPRVYLTGFGIASSFSEQAIKTSAKDRLEGTLSTISPEQTGRISRTVDYRTDFYSLGVVMYHMLAGYLPFEFDSSIEMIYAHLAKEPKDLREVNPDIPEMIVRLIKKLLSKDADDRYQSANGIIADLMHCQRKWQDDHAIAEFELAKGDFTQSYIYPGKLFGRDDEFSRLDGIFQRSCGGSVEMLLIRGAAGIGKTELVNNLRTSIGQKNGYLMKGKCDLMSRAPYISFVQAISDGVDQLLLQSQEIIERVKQTWISILGMNGRALTDTIPALKAVLGDLPSIPELPPEQARNRLHLAVQKMLSSAISLRGRPIVIFLDDLQWADQQTLRLLESLCCDTDQRSLLLVGAYRDDEVDEDHGLFKMKQNILSVGGKLSEIVLKPLDIHAIQMLVTHAFQPLRQSSGSFAEICLRKTGGNPFFIRQLLSELVESGAVYFDPESSSWRWDKERVVRSQIAENVVDYLAAKLKGFELNMQKMLGSAACIGTVFDLETLSHINDRPLQYCLDTLWPAVSEQYITLVQSDRKFLAATKHNISELAPRLLPGGDVSDVRFLFVHDRFYEAAYSQLSTAERIDFHQRIGSYWLVNKQQAEISQSLHNILGQLNRAIPSLESFEEKKKLAFLNLQGGTAAKVQSHFETAFEYFKTGIDLLGDRGWTEAYEETRDLYNKGIQAAFLSGYYDELHRWFVTLKRESATPVDCVDGYISLILKEMTQHNLQEGIAKGLEILHLLGVSFPQGATVKDFMSELRETEAMLSRYSLDDIVALPKMEDEKDLAVLRIIFAMISACYLADRILHHLLVLKCVQLTLLKGVSLFSSMIFCTLGFILNVYPEKVKYTKHFGETGLRLKELSMDHNAKVRTNFVYDMGIASFQRHLRGVIDDLYRDQRRFGELGNLVHQGNTLYIITHLQFVQGIPLEKQLENITISLKELAKIRHQVGAMIVLPLKQTIFNLMGLSEHTTELIGDAFDERPLNWQDRSNETYFVTLYQCKMILTYHFDNFVEAERYFEKIVSSGYAVNVPPLFAKTMLFGALSCLALADQKSAEQRKLILEKTATLQEGLRQFAESAPMNFSHSYSLLRAERARVGGDHELAEKYYELAIEDAKINGYLQDEALANELAAKYWMRRERSVLGGMFMQRALDCYGQWGAGAKVEDLKKKFHAVIHNDKKVNGWQPDHPKNTISEEDFGIMSALRASRAISGEMELHRLLDKLMGVVLENAGATRGCFLLEKEDRFFLTAVSDVEQAEIITQFPDFLEMNKASDLIPLHVINYVCHARERSVLVDAREDHLFRFDPYIQKKKPRAILCTPLIRKEKLIGVLYLENNLLSGAFSEDKLQMVEILTAQIGVSLENAMFYEQKLKAEAALFSEKERLAVTLRSIGEGVITTDILGMITSLNTTAENITGWSNQDAIGEFLQNVFTTFTESGDPQWRDLVATVLQSNSPTELPENAILVTGDGIRKNIMASCAPIHDSEGETIGSVLVFKDVTDKLHMEERIQQAQKMEAVGTLAGGIAHDFNNILSPIIGYSELLLEGLGDNHTLRNPLLMIHQAGTRGRDVVKQILLIGRKQEKKMEAVRLQDIVKEVHKLCSSMLPASIELILDVHWECSPILADGPQMHQVLMNLITNATQAIKTGVGQIIIRLQEVEKETVTSEIVKTDIDTFIMLSVEDSGCGMSPEIRKKIFDPYFTTKDSDKGTGLGLATSHGIVQEHNGSIEVESTAGEGSIFRVVLPAFSGDSQKFQLEKEQAKDLIGTAKILLVEDEFAIASLGQGMLENLGYTVTICTDSAKALEIFQKVPDNFDLVITDMTMPKITGDMLAEKMVSIKPQIPIIACSGYSERLNHLSNDSTLFRATLKKPFTKDDLGKVVKDVLKPQS